MSISQDEPLLVRFEESLTQAALSSSTVINYLADLHAFLRWGNQKVDANFSLLQANAEHIRLYRDHLISELKRAASTVNRHLMALRKFFAFALGLELISTDPTAGVSLVQDNGQTPSRSLTVKEVEKLLEAAQQGSRAGLIRRDLAILLLLLHTGLRVGEIVDLKKDDVVFDNPGVHLQVCDNHLKDKRRRLPLQGKVCKALHDYLLVRSQISGSNQLFLSQDGRAVSKRTIQRIISNCAKTAQLDGITAQSIRRTFALRLLSETKDLDLVSERLGHQNKKTTEHYLAVQSSVLLIKS